MYEDITRHFNTKDNKDIAIVGDRLLTDIVMGNQFGFFTIETKPFTTKRENFMVRLSRAFENRILP